MDVWTALWWVAKNGTLLVAEILKDSFLRDGKAERRRGKSDETADGDVQKDGGLPPSPL